MKIPITTQIDRITIKDSFGSYLRNSFNLTICRWRHRVKELEDEDSAACKVACGLSKQTVW